jgi:hypothetical protein
MKENAKMNISHIVHPKLLKHKTKDNFHGNVPTFIPEQNSGAGHHNPP